MKWTDMKQAILDRLNMSLLQAQRLDYLNQMPRYTNECLSFMANALRLNTSEYKFETDRPNQLVAMPPDFIAFLANITLYYQSNILYEMEPWVASRYIGANKIICDQPGIYTFYYKSHFPSLVDIEGQTEVWAKYEWDEVANKQKPFHIKHYSSGEQKDLELYTLPRTIAELIPDYVASKLLAIDDVSNAMRLRNDFELNFSRLDDSVIETPGDFVSVRGWY